MSSQRRIKRPDQLDTMPPPSARAPEAKTLLALQCDVLEAVATGRPLVQILDLLCRRVEQLVPSVVCSVLTVDDEARLRPLSAPSLPEAYCRALDGTKIGIEVGSCGTAAFLGSPVEVRDIATDPRWTPYKKMPLEAGLRACWSSPIKGRDSRVVGTFAFYFSTCRGPNAFERTIVDTSVHLCALAIEHDMVWSRLQRTNQCFDLALSNMSQGLCIFDSAQQLVAANSRYSEIYGLSPDMVRPGMSIAEIVKLRIAAGSGPNTSTEAYLDLRNALHASSALIDRIIELTNGRAISVHYRPLPDSGWVSTHEDVTERRRTDAHAVYMAQHDELTGLPNRVLFSECTEQALGLPGKKHDCAVLCLDLDKFKAVNDTFGHPVGDALLRGVAERLRALVQEGDTVTRLGGDEFAILLLGLHRRECAWEFAKRIIEGLADPFELDGHRVVIGVSIGIALAQPDATSAVLLLKRADTALYRAKLDEPGSYRYFEPEMDARLQTRIALERDLREGARDERFELVYQPQFSLERDKLCGFETLLRWRHPTRGIVGPAEFIPVAEETGLIIPIGDWVLQHACMEAMNWPDSLSVAVNLSAVQIKKHTLVQTVRRALAASGLPAARLELEITESVLLKNNQATLLVLHELRDLGVGISMDDFGTGYSSLSYLRSFPFNKIKIDQSFVRAPSQNAQSEAIIHAIVALAKSLGMKTLAEGVETELQLGMLRSAGCDEVQGYLFSKPISPEAAALMAHGISDPVRA